MKLFKNWFGCWHRWVVYAQPDIACGIEHQKCTKCNLKRTYSSHQGWYVYDKNSEE